MNTRQPAHPYSNVLLLGSNSVYCLLPSTLISQADALLEVHKLEDVVALADQHLKKLQGRVSVSPEDADELRYVFQRIGFQYLTETSFDNAGKHFFTGNLDPRVLVSYFPELYGSLFSSEDSVDVYAGIVDYMPPEESIDEIIAMNLVRNYSPNLSPNTSTAPPAVELKGLLKAAATAMLKVFLHMWRTRRRKEEPQFRRINEVVDTILAKLYTEAGETTDLMTLIDGSNDIVLTEIEPALVKAQRYDALCKLLRSRGEHTRLLQAWSRLVTGEWVNEDVHDPLTSMFNFLTEKRDKTLSQEWGIWLLKQDPDRALKLLTGTGKRGGKASADDAALLQRIQEASPSAGAQFLEHVVLQKRSTDPGHHMQLASTYVDQLCLCLGDESTAKLWRAKAASYASSWADVSFLSYFASTTPDSESKRIRLKAILFLQGSSLYDPNIVRLRIHEHEKLLGLELAIINGKLEHHQEALSTLVHTLHDTSSAQAYCTLGGEVVPAKIAQSIGERFDLQPWSSLFGVPVAKARAVASSIAKDKTVDEALKRDLIKILLKVYMSEGESMMDQTAQFINAQANNFDALDVLGTISPEWSLRISSTFLARTLRRTLHARHEGQILKAISASENLAVAERAWLFTREQGAFLQEMVDDDEGDGSLTEKFFDETMTVEINEKVSEDDIHLEGDVEDVIASYR